MPDELIYESPQEEWMSILARLWIAFDKPLDADRLRIYSDELSAIPMGLLEKAISRTIREHRFSNVPSIGDVWRALQTELGNPYDLQQAIESWCDRQWRKVVVEFKAPAETELS